MREKDEASMMKRICLLVSVLVVLLFAGCASSANLRQSTAETSFFAMDTIMSIRAYGAEASAMERAKEWVSALEDQLSVTRESSEIYQINHSGSGQVTGEAADLLRRALELCRETEGALDLTIYPVVRAWGFTSGDYRVPDDSELADLLRFVDYQAVELNADGSVQVPEGVQLDLGAVAKGYVGDRLSELLRAEGVESALLDLGGNIQTIGGKPDGSEWRVGIQDPAADTLLGTLRIRDCAVITSGGYERYFTDESGHIWWHIMDPSTGKSAQNGLVSVTVMGPEGLVCDALSTALFVMGEARAVKYWRAHPTVELALLTEDGRLLLTPGMAARFQAANDLEYIITVLE